MTDLLAQARNKIKAGQLPAASATPFLPVMVAYTGNYQSVVCGLCDRELVVGDRWYRLFPHTAGAGTIELHEACYEAWRQETTGSK